MVLRRTGPPPLAITVAVLREHVAALKVELDKQTKMRAFAAKMLGRLKLAYEEMTGEPIPDLNSATAAPGERGSVSAKNSAPMSSMDGDEIPAEVATMIRKVMRSWIFRRRFRALVTEYVHSPQSKGLRHRNQVYWEIHSSEKVFVEGLATAVSGFVGPLRALMAAKPKIKAACHDDFVVMCSNIEVLLNVNSTLLSSLEQRSQEWPKIWVEDIFDRIIPYLRLYTTYVNNYPNAVDALRRLQDHSAFAEKLRDLERSPMLNNLHLKDFLILPVQRVPRYVMLLADLYKHTPEEDQHYAGLGNTVARMQELALSINQSSLEASNMKEMFDVHKGLDAPQHLTSLLGSLVAPSRKLVARFVGAAQSFPAKKKSEETELILFNDLLVTGRPKKNAKGKSGSTKLREWLILHSVHVVETKEVLQTAKDKIESTDPATTFALRSPHLSSDYLIVQAPTAAARTKWFSAISSAAAAAAADYERARQSMSKQGIKPVEDTVPRPGSGRSNGQWFGTMRKR